MKLYLTATMSVNNPTLLHEQAVIKRLALRWVIGCFVCLELLNVGYFYLERERFIAEQLHQNTLLTTKYFDQKIKTQIRVLQTV